MFYYLYEVKNNLNGKIYVGVHKTKSLDDGYMGSGKVIRSAIMKHGIENFTKVILEQFDNSTDMYAREKEVVTDEFLLRKDVYNLRRGGSGGFDYINANKTAEEKTRIAKLARKNSPGNKGITRSKEWKEKISCSMTGRSGGKGTTGFLFSDKSKLKMSASALGKKNSQYGKMWITNGKENKSIKKFDTIPKDYWRGRTLNKRCIT